MYKDEYLHNQLFNNLLCSIVNFEMVQLGERGTDFLWNSVT